MSVQFQKRKATNPSVRAVAFSNSVLSPNLSRRTLRNTNNAGDNSGDRNAYTAFLPRRKQ